MKRSWRRSFNARPWSAGAPSSRGSSRSPTRRNATTRSVLSASARAVCSRPARSDGLLRAAVRIAADMVLLVSHLGQHRVKRPDHSLRTPSLDDVGSASLAESSCERRVLEHAGERRGHRPRMPRHEESGLPVADRFAEPPVVHGDYRRGASHGFEWDQTKGLPNLTACDDRGALVEPYDLRKRDALAHHKLDAGADRACSE